MSISDSGFPVLFDTQPSSTATSTPVFQPGAIFVWKSGTGRVKRSLVQYVQLDNNGCSYGEALQINDATVVAYSVKKASTAKDSNFVGIAAGTIASQKFGFMVIGGYCEYAYTIAAAASGDSLALSASTYGRLSAGVADTYYTASATNVSGLLGVAIANGAISAGALGSVTLCGIWGV
jgi:hypothetical protein